MWSWPGDKDNVRMNYAVLSATVCRDLEQRSHLKSKVSLPLERKSPRLLTIVYPVPDVNDFNLCMLPKYGSIAFTIRIYNLCCYIDEHVSFPNLSPDQGLGCPCVHVMITL